MASTPELTRTLSPRPRPSAADLSPSGNAPIPRCNSSASTIKKRPRGGEEPLNNLLKDTSTIHNSQSTTPPPAQLSPEKLVTHLGFVSSHSGRGGISGRLSGSPDSIVMAAVVSSSQVGGSSPDRTMAASVSSSRVENGDTDRTIMPAWALSEGAAVNAGEGEGGDSSGIKDGARREEKGIAEEEHEERGNSGLTDDLLVQLPNYDWTGFVTRLGGALKEVGAERGLLSEEYDMWNWMYGIWSSSRDRNDIGRLSREMATIIQWTKLKEADLERAREAHTQSMLAISTVLGIIPKNNTPPAGER